MNRYWWQDYEYFKYEDDDNRADFVRIAGYEHGINIIWFNVESLVDKRVHRISEEEFSARFVGANELPEEYKN